VVSVVFGVAVLVGSDVLVGSAVLVGAAVLVGSAVSDGAAVLVGSAVSDGAAALSETSLDGDSEGTAVCWASEEVGAEGLCSSEVNALETAETRMKAAITMNQVRL